VQLAEERSLDELAEGLAQVLVGHARRVLQAAEAHIEVAVNQQIEGNAQQVEQQHLPVVGRQHATENTTVMTDASSVLKSISAKRSVRSTSTNSFDTKRPLSWLT